MQCSAAATTGFCIWRTAVNHAGSCSRFSTSSFTPCLPSAFDIWRGSDWMEREVYDLLGIQFTGHPDLRRILMPDEFAGHPLRKDYPLRGMGERHHFVPLARDES